jgi:hypothetical protein
MPGGRPSDYSQETVDAICERLADGESLRSICRDDDMPSTVTVSKWLAKHEEFVSQYVRARELQADAMFDDILEIADGKRTLIEGGDPDVQRDRLAVDARKWMAGKLKGKYSEKLKHIGGDEDDPAIAFTGFKRQFID